MGDQRRTRHGLGAEGLSRRRALVKALATPTRRSCGWKAQNASRISSARADAAALDNCIGESGFGRAASRRRGQEEAGSFFGKGMAGDWRSVSSQRGRVSYDTFAREELMKVGYERSYDR